MALSDRMSKLAARAKEAESAARRAREGAGPARAEVGHAREAAQAQADELEATRKTKEANVAAW